MDTIEVEVKIEKRVDVSVDITDVIATINEAPMKKRWNYISQLINGVELDLSDMTDEQRAIIKKYLDNKLLLF